MSPDDPKIGFQEEALAHMDAVYRFALRLAGSADEAEDLVQETFLRAYRSWDQYTTGTRAKSWLFTICRNVFLRQRERGRRHDEIVQEESGRDLSESGGNVINPVWVSNLGRDPEGEFFDSIVDDQVLSAIDALPEEYRTAVVLSDLEGLSYQEIGELMEVPVGTVKSRLFRGRRQLQKVLYEYAVEMGYIEERVPGRGEGEEES
ncbi:MAG: sigma-70 family RNA polymerase sigma factor [Longimicrobiales bacterium]|nr:sigma-70 family RNA polymerase sigma factor [Longimicrobiales bacterium]